MKIIFITARILLCSLCLVWLVKPALAQDRPVQPKIMVIPRVKKDENMKRLYDSSMNIQIALAKINEAFEKRGANIVRFDEKLKQAEENMLMDKASNNQEDYRSLVLQLSGADIYVEAKLDVTRHSNQSANSVTIILDGYQKGTGNGLGTKTGFSRIVQTDNIGFLTAQAMENIAEEFLNLMQSRFTDIVENGQSMHVEFSISNSSDRTFNSEVDQEGNSLSQKLRGFIKKIAFKGKYNFTGVVGNKMILSDVKFPLRNPADPAEDFTGDDAYAAIYKQCKAAGIKVTLNFASNNKILITIL